MLVEGVLKKAEKNKTVFVENLVILSLAGACV